MCISTKYWILYALCHIYVWPNYKLNRSCKIQRTYHALILINISSISKACYCSFVCYVQFTYMWRSENVLSNNATDFVFAHEIISLKISKTQNFRKTRHFLNRAVINGLIYRTLPRLMVKINPPLAVMINHPLTVSVLPNPFHTTTSQLYYSRNCVAQFHDIKAYFFNLPYH